MKKQIKKSTLLNVVKTYAIFTGTTWVEDDAGKLACAALGWPWPPDQYAHYTSEEVEIVDD